MNTLANSGKLYPQHIGEIHTLKTNSYLKLIESCSDSNDHNRKWVFL
jgi:hypothetical protein